jgi:hypothetical protein
MVRSLQSKKIARWPHLSGNKRVITLNLKIDCFHAQVWNVDHIKLHDGSSCSWTTHDIANVVTSFEPASFRLESVELPVRNLGPGEVDFWKKARALLSIIVHVASKSNRTYEQHTRQGHRTIDMIMVTSPNPVFLSHKCVLQPEEDESLWWRVPTPVSQPTCCS